MPDNYFQITSGTGQNWATAANWSLQAAPIASETTHLVNSSATITAGLNQQTITLTALHAPMTFTGAVGVDPSTSGYSVKTVTGITRSSNTATATSTAHGYSNGDVVEVAGADQTDYNIVATISNVAANTFDYTVANTPATPATTSTVMTVRKVTALYISATNTYIGAAGGGATASSGSGLLRFVYGSVQNATTVYNTSSSSTVSGKEPLIIRGTHASNTLTVYGGRVGVATERPGDVGTLLTASLYGGTTNFSSGVTLGTLNVNGGTGNTNAAVTTVNQEDGTWNHSAGNITTYNGNGGTAEINGSTATINLEGATLVHNAAVTTAVNMYAGELDLTQNNTARTIASIVLQEPRGSDYSVSIDMSYITLTSLTIAANARIKITVTAL